MNFVFAFFYTIFIFIAIAFWEAYMEGPNGWASKQYGWSLNLGIRKLTAYHFWSWIIMIPLFLLLPLVVFGFDKSIFWFLVGSYFIGTVVEDFTWFVVNPKFPLKNFNSDKVKWHKWIKIGKFEIPDFYIPYLIIGIFVYIFLV
ncbi:hypothetical protein J4414_03055 [Candidatus Woesearchaeota archaeon]|nr:hypothetical protein [Candidatus Woesearchaeota archaeon]